MKRAILTVSLVFLWVGVFQAHDLSLKLETFFLKPHANVSIALFNGTFEKNENAISRDRMLDVGIVGPEDERIHPDTSQWRDVGPKALLDFKTGEPVTYVVGVSTARRIVHLSANEFNEYFKHDGVLDILAHRERRNELDKDARERYSKHVKAIIQVGEKRTSGFSARLGYPVEIVPLQNPYELNRGDTLEVRVLKDGKALANQLLYASYEGFHAHDDEGGHREAIQTRTDDNGLARLELAESVRGYIRLIHMEKVQEEGVDYESNWATLIFEVQ